MSHGYPETDRIMAPLLGLLQGPDWNPLYEKIDRMVHVGNIRPAEELVADRVTLLSVPRGTPDG